MPLILLVFVLCPPLLLVSFIAADAGDAGYRYLYISLALAGLLNGAIYAVIGPSFWRLLRSIRESATSK